MWEKAQILSILKSTPVLVGAASLLAGGVGATAGYRVAHNRLEEKFKELSEREIEEAREYYSQLNRVVSEYKPPTPQAALAEKAASAHLNYQGVSVEAPVETEEQLLVEETTVTVERNVFTTQADDLPEEDSGWDYEAERARRTGKTPYVISKEEFNENARDYEQTYLTYYAGDDALSDGQDEPIYDVERTVGEDNLLRFGHGSGSEHIVYIRNDVMELDFEITRSEGKFAHEVMNFIEHSEDTTIRKFRGYHE